MKLYVDIGNSRIKLIPEDKGFGEPVSSRYERGSLTDVLTPLSAILPCPGTIMASNVAGDAIAAEFNGFCRQTWSVAPDYITPTSEYLGLKNGYKNPEKLGVDRWLAMLAAWHYYSVPLCIVDCGTALTLDIIAADGRHRGGYILPGVGLMIRSLSGSTAGIRPEPGPEINRGPGRTTGEGVSHGALRASTAFIEDIFREYGVDAGVEMKCVLTGGDVDMFSRHLSIPVIMEPLLVFKGIRLVDENMP